MKFATIIQHKMKALVIAFAAVLLGIFIGYLSTNTSAIPYEGPDTQPSPVPAFNVYTGVTDGPFTGDESNFYKGKVEGSSSPATSDIRTSCETGTQLSLRAYVHNGASQFENGNGNGPSVAQGTRIRMTVPNNEASDFSSTATISATNAASVSDSLTITCTDGRVVTLHYIPGTAEQFSPLSGVKPVSDSIVTPSGAPIGTMEPNGQVWGCWDQRVWVRILVEIKEVPPALHPAVCESILAVLTNNTVTVEEINYELNDATLNFITIAYGDGNNAEIQSRDDLPVSHTYANPGNYTITATLNTTFEGRTQEVTGNCKTKVDVKPEPKVVKECKLIEPPVRVNRVTYLITAQAIVQNTEVTSYTFTTTNDEGVVVNEETFNTDALQQTYEFFQVNEGTYTVKAVIQTTDGQAEGDCETKITVEPEPVTPVVACEDPKPVLDGRKLTFSFIPLAEGGATFRSANVKFFQNGSVVREVNTDNVGSDGRVMEMYTYPDSNVAITADVTATLLFTIPDGEDGEDEVVECVAEAVLGAVTPTPTPTPTPRPIPVTGPGEAMAGIFAAVAGIGAFAHRKFTLKRQ